MATTNAFSLASPPLARICLHGDLQRFGRRLSLYVNTAAEAIRALSMQMPGFRRQMNEGWYQIRIAGDDTAPEAVYARLHEQLGEGTVIHIVPRLAGAERVDCRLCWGRQPSWALSSLPGHQWRYGVQPWQPVVFLPPRCCFHLEPA
ncbi:tail assembly protein I [Escherichia coli DEC3D]|nr:tail assembly protein I [Escherichia coli DEC3D]